MSKIILRDALPEDAAALLAIYKPYVEQTAISFECAAPSTEEFVNRIRIISAKYPYLAAEADGRIVGYAYAHEFGEREAYNLTAELSVYVERDERRGGIGRMLYEELEHRLKEGGYHSMVAVITAPQTEEDPYSSLDSQKFHARMGFVKAGHLHQCGFKFGRWYDVVHMEKLIQEVQL